MKKDIIISLLKLLRFSALIVLCTSCYLLVPKDIREEVNREVNEERKDDKWIFLGIIVIIIFVLVFWNTKGKKR